MAESVVSFVGQTIGKLLINEAKFLFGVKSKVKDLLKELKLIQDLLRDADARREHEAVGEWVAQLQDIAYDAEDVIEQYILRVALKKEQGIIKAYARFVAKCTCMQVHAVGTKIEGLKSSISNIRTSMVGYGIQPVKDGERQRVRASMPKRSYAHFEECFVGREDSIKELVEELLKDGRQHRVTSIWGMGGLGKTALAKKVFNHEKVRSNFDGFAWACVSQEYDVKDILMEILAQLNPDKREIYKKMMNHELFEILYRIQQEKRCIVVLDDIWTKQAWDNLRAAFPIENTRSKLLMTTRNRKVAEYINPQGLFHEPRCLSDQESWDLLEKMAFPATKELTENMKKLRDELLKKCGGLPIAVTVLGGLLAIDEWEKVYKNFNLHFRDKSDVSEVLALSYDNLPWHLKPCFLYLGSFPTEEEIPIKEVLHMWIAEGFVSLNALDEEGEITVEDVAEQYLMELVNRGMVQARFNSSGKIKTCRLHHLMQDLCISKSRQERFLSILKVQQDNETEDYSSSMEKEFESTCKTRRLSLSTCMTGEGNTIPGLKQIGRTMLHLRTLVFFYYGGTLPRMWKQFKPIFINCKFLRVLKLEGLSMIKRNLPKSVGDLVHLRYLSLAGSDLEGLPQSMRNLVCMEFLDLRGSKNFNVTVPNVLWKMKRLRHLYLPFLFVVDGPKKLRLDSLKDLHTLKNFHLENCDVNNIGKLTNLRKLTVFIQYGFDELEIIPQLAKFTLKHLQFSSFRFEREEDSVTEGELSKMSSYQHFCNLSIHGKIEKLPEHKNLPQQLRKLVLENSELEEDPMPILEKLNYLVVLILSRAFVGKKMVCSAEGFPQLRHLVLVYLENLEQWRVAEGAMPQLSQLGIGNCPELEESIKVRQGVYVYDGSGVIGDKRWKNNVRQLQRAILLRKIRAHAQAIRVAQLFQTYQSSLAVSPLEASEESSINLCEEHETSDEGELCNNDVSPLEAYEESSTNLA